MTRHPLANTQTHIWIIRSVSSVTLDDIHSYRALLSPEENQHNQTITRLNIQIRDLITRVFIRTTLSRYCSLAPKDWLFGVSDTGKPHITNPETPLHFNISHSGDLIACVISTHANTGIDLEKINHQRRWHDIAKHYFSPAELCYIEAKPLHLRCESFYRIWTLKESYLKATGEGISNSLADISFHLNTGSAILTLKQSAQPEQGWFFTSLTPEPNYSAAIAVCPTTSEKALNLSVYSQPVDKLLTTSAIDSFPSPDYQAPFFCKHPKQ